MTSALLCVGPDDIDRTWPLVEKMIGRAFLDLDAFMPDVFAWLKAGRGLLWVAVRDDEIVGAVTTSLEKRPSGMACRLVSYGASVPNVWADHIEQVESYARDVGCTKVCLDGRRGWERLLSGYAPTTVSLEKGL